MDGSIRFWNVGVRYGGVLGYLLVEEELYKSQWLTLGGALLVAGFVIDSDWLFAVLTSSGARHYAFFSWPLIIPTILVAAGVYAMCAANTLWLRIIGQKRLLRLVDQRERSRIYLANFSTIGAWFASGHDANSDRVIEWYRNLREFVRTVWGVHESAALVAINRPTAPDETAAIVNARVLNLIERCGTLRIRQDILWIPEPAWKVYIETADLLYPQPKSDPNVD